MTFNRWVRVVTSGMCFGATVGAGLIGGAWAAALVVAGCAAAYALAVADSQEYGRLREERLARADEEAGDRIVAARDRMGWHEPPARATQRPATVEVDGAEVYVDVDAARASVYGVGRGERRRP
jgi:hypothetical protein